MHKEIILGIPFLAIFYPFKVDSEGIKTIYKGQNICFKFTNPIQTKELNTLQNEEVNLIQKKKQHTKFISKEIHYKRIEENLLQKAIQTRMEKIKNQIETELCSSIPNAFWDIKKHKVSLPYIDGFDEAQIATKVRPIQMNA